MKIFQISTFDLRNKWAEAVDTNDKTDENLNFKDLTNLLDMLKYVSKEKNMESLWIHQVLPILRQITFWLLVCFA